MGHPVAWESAPVVLAVVDSRPVVAPVVVDQQVIRQGAAAQGAAAVAVTAGSADRQGRQPGTPQRALMYLCCCCRRNQSRS